ncbi:branched-chain amino acid ABC transporter permease [Pokkaliibacter plantistimulans]|uniref:Branched-chain amino acid ABC transporter permease n=1 Tax=Proteobacteria bacterium 228 TaxID=2083153 RepID=A0A2S5KLI2_9PROT|nr:branched-chain amino acid ABC transporter permease [Pokkaliibacter plantistimulans]PPC75176.1 branched-chain amino acid ABC transporter permease [Pokkaliibacter plantistimulans]
MQVTKTTTLGETVALNEPLAPASSQQHGKVQVSHGTGRRWPLSRWLTLLTFAVLLALPVLLAVLDNSFLLTLVSRCMIYGIAAISLNLILGYGGMLSLGHAAFFGIGAYVVGITAQNFMYGTALMEWPFELAASNDAIVVWPVAILLSALAALLIGAISLRTSGVYFLMLTLAFAQMIYFIFVSLDQYGGDDGMNLMSRNTLLGLDLDNDLTFYYVCFGCLLLIYLLVQRLIAARFGMVLRGCKQNEQRMQAMGFPTYRYRLMAFALAGAGAGLAGALIGNQMEYVSPNLLHWKMSGELMVMVLLGGLGTLLGPLWGAFAFLLVEDVLSGITEHWMLFFGPFLILVVLFAKGGIYGYLIRKEQP